MLRPLKQEIVNHVCYREVFNAPVELDQLQCWLGINEANVEEFICALDELVEEGIVVKKLGFIASPANVESIDNQFHKTKLTKKLLKKGSGLLKFLSKLPFIKYVGVSGSLAAQNPTSDKNGGNNGKVDLDLFVITSANTLWIFLLVERTITKIRRLLLKNHFYCFNYVTDETYLEVISKNFYTATEVNNLHTIYDDDVYREFIYTNRWFRNYYFSGHDVYTEHKVRKASLTSYILYPINYLCYLLFTLSQTFLKLDYSSIMEVFKRSNANPNFNLKRNSNPNGGYQEAIYKRFSKLYFERFSDYYASQVIDQLFPNIHSFSSNKLNNGNRTRRSFYTKYELSSNEKNPV